jgi:hypothetical protein
MPCCGQGRQALKTEPAATASQPALRAAPESAPLALGGAVRLRFLHRSPVRVQGPVSGRWYEFSGEAADQMVDARDAHALTATGYFRAV